MHIDRSKRAEAWNKVAEQGQVLIDHEDIPGLMPAMTMNFIVPDEEVLSRLAAGQRKMVDHSICKRVDRNAIQICQGDIGQCRGHLSSQIKLTSIACSHAA